MIGLYFCKQNRLEACVRHYALQNDITMREWNLQYMPSGKPYFVGIPEIHVSISHSGAYWVCALAPEMIGVDVERQRENGRFARIAERFFHPDEAAYLKRTNYTDFFTVWTAKESYVKYTGQGITNEFHAFSVVQDGKVASNVGAARLVAIPFDDAYALCICTSAMDAIACVWMD